MKPFYFFRSAPTRFGPVLVMGALACWGFAVFLLYYPLVAAVIAAAMLGVAGLALLGLGAALWRAETAARRMMDGGAPPPAPGAGPVRDAEATWRDGNGPSRLP